MLRGEDVGFARSNAVDRGRTLLESTLHRIGRTQRVMVNPNILGDGRVAAKRRTAHGREEFLGQHLRPLLLGPQGTLALASEASWYCPVLVPARCNTGGGTR